MGCVERISKYCASPKSVLDLACFEEVWNEGREMTLERP